MKWEGVKRRIWWKQDTWEKKQKTVGRIDRTLSHRFTDTAPLDLRCSSLSRSLNVITGGAFSLPQRIRVKQSLSLRVGAFWAQSRPQFSIISSHITSLIYLPSSSQHPLHQHLLLSKVLFLSFLFFLFSHIFSATKHCCCCFSFGLYASDLISSCAVKKKKKIKEKNVVIVVSLCYCYFLLWFELGGICRFLGGQTRHCCRLGCRLSVVDCWLFLTRWFSGS